MRTRFWLVLGVSCIAACSDPSGVPTTRARTLTVPRTGSLTANVKEPISGTVSFIGGGAPGNFRTTPSGNCFFTDVPVYDHFEGDVVGPVTFYEDERAPCDFGHLTGVGPFVAQVTWDGLSGTISGQWETNCKADPTQPIGLSCDGTMNGRGSGGLDGVNFHFKWGPGWYPFPYTGTAFSQ